MLHPEAPLAIRLLLGLHIFAGSAALLVVPVVMSVVKGGTTHRRLGLVFVYAMFFVAVSALIIAPFFRDYFLLLIAIFSGYLTFLGWRSLARKNPSVQPARPVDWIGAILAIGAGTGLVALGFFQRDSFGAFAVVLAVLGSICAGVGGRSIYRFYRPPVERGAWLFAHFTNMLAAYIATVTAFSSVNFHFLQPIWVRWLWPTLIGTTVIVLYTRAYRAKFARGTPFILGPQSGRREHGGRA